MRNPPINTIGGFFHIMKHFFELLDSYNKRRCCVSPVNEGATRAQRAAAAATQQQKMADTAGLINQAIKTPNQELAAPGGTWKLVPKVDDSNQKVIGYSIFTSIDGNKSYPVDLNGNIQATGSRLSRIQNFLLGKDEEKKTDSTQNQGKTPGERFPEVDLEEARKRAKIEADNLEINESLTDIVSQYDDEAVCRARLNIGALLDVFRPDKDRPSTKPSRESAETKISEKLEKRRLFITRSTVTAIHSVVRDNYPKLQNNEPGAACAFLSDLEKKIDATFVTDEDKEAFRSVFIFPEDLSQHVINLTSNNQNSIAMSIDLANNPKVAETIEYILKGHCQKEEDDCVPPESLPEEQINAVKDNMKIVLSLAAKDELNDEEKALLQSLIMITDTGKVAVAGVSFLDSIILPDRGRAFADTLRFIERKHGISFDILELEGRITSEGALNTLIGTAFEHWHSLVDLLNMRSKTKDPKTQEAITRVATVYYNRLANLCESMRAMKQRLGNISSKGPAIPTDEYAKIVDFNNEVGEDCSELSDMNRVMSNHVYKSIKNRNPDLMVQVGKEVGKGLRADIVLGFYDRKQAEAAAKASGLNPKKAVKKTTVGEMLARNPKYAAMLINSGIIGKGKEIDPDTEIFTFDEGLKVTSGRGSSAVKTGTASLNSIQEDIEEGASSPWVKNVGEALGLKGQSLVNAVEGARKIFRNLDKVDKILERSLPKMNVDGTLESTARLTATEIMTNLRDQNIEGVLLQKDEVFRAATAFAKEANRKNPDPKALAYAREELAKAVKKRVLEQYLEKRFNSLKKDDRAAAALIVGMVGGVRNDQSLQHADLLTGDQHIVDHNTIAVTPFMEAINNPDNKVTIRRARDSFSVSVKCANGPTITVRFTGLTGASSISKSVFDKGCGGPSPAIKLESHQKNQLLGVLKSQLEVLAEIFGQSSKPKNIFSDT